MAGEWIKMNKSLPRGLDEDAVMQLIARMESYSSAANDEAVRLAGEDMDGEACDYQDGLAYAYNDCAKWLRDALREQQGERPENARDGLTTIEAIADGLNPATHDTP